MVRTFEADISRVTVSVGVDLRPEKFIILPLESHAAEQLRWFKRSHSRFEIETVGLQRDGMMPVRQRGTATSPASPSGSVSADGGNGLKVTSG
jgi:hypothetical protein